MIKFFAFIVELMAWFQIVLFPLMIGLVLGGLIYVYKQDTIGLSLGILVASLGLILGIRLANRIRKKKGSIHFLSRIRATPELDKNPEIQENKNLKNK